MSTLNKAFTVDRKGLLTEGLVMNLHSIPPGIRPEARDLLEARYPDGLSHHGLGYLFGSVSIDSAQIEIFFELIRRAHFPEAPSRYSSIFASEQLSDAIEFRERRCASEGSIWELEFPASAFRADASCLKGTVPVFELEYLAHLYWSGDSSGIDAPDWELLITPPAIVSREVG